MSVPEKVLECYHASLDLSKRTSYAELDRALEIAWEKGHGEILLWLSERREHERRNAPADSNNVMGGMAMGALETLDALEAWLKGDDKP